MSKARRILILVVYLAGCLLLALWLVPTPRLPRQHPVAEAQWQMPVLPSPAAQAAYARLLKSRPWGGLGDVAGGGTVSSAKWQLRGIIQQDTERFALVEANDDVHRFGLGEQLPDGSLLVEIAADRIQVETQGNRQELRLYRGSSLIAWVADMHPLFSRRAAGTQRKTKSSFSCFDFRF